MEVVVILLTITLGDPLAKCLLPVSATLWSAGLEILATKGGMLLSGDTTVISLNWKLWLPPGHFGFLNAPEPKGVTAGWINNSCYYSTMEARRVFLEHRKSLRVPLSVIMPCNCQWKLQQPNQGRSTNGTVLLEMAVWVTPLSKAEVLPKAKKNTEWIVEETTYKYQLWPSSQLQEQKL